MNRIDFINLIGSGTLLALAGKTDLFNHSKTGSGLVDTPEKRLEYSRRMLIELCTDLGPRPSGSDAFHKGAGIIHKEMKRSLSLVSYDTYEFEKWELIGDAEFSLGSQGIEVVPAYGGIGTPPDGIKGVIVQNKDAFTLTDAVSGQRKALFTVSPYGKAITHYQSHRQQPALPSFCIGRQDRGLLEKAATDKTAAFARLTVRYIPGARGSNIVGKLAGKSTKEIVFVSHADTVYNSPGANDNTASVIIMLMLAHAAVGRSHNHTLRFIATDNEEFGYFGALNYAKKRRSDGSMKNIRVVVNFDSLTYGPNLWISSQQDDIKELIRNIHKDLDIKTTPIYDSSDGYVMDSEPFRSSGAKALHVNSRGYDDKTLPVYHRPDDTAANVPLDCLEIGFRVFDEFIQRVDKW